MGSNGQAEGDPGGIADFSAILYSLFGVYFGRRLARVTECHRKSVQIIYLRLKRGPA
jgi:hypothetical protein